MLMNSKQTNRLGSEVGGNVIRKSFLSFYELENKEFDKTGLSQ